MSELQQIIPRPGEIRPDKPYRTPDQRWEEVSDEIYGSHELPENILFDHNPVWNRRFWSIQNIRDQTLFFAIPTLDLSGGPPRPRRFGFWSVVGFLMLAGDLGWLFFRIRH